MCIVLPFTAEKPTNNTTATKNNFISTSLDSQVARLLRTDFNCFTAHSECMQVC